MPKKDPPEVPTAVVATFAGMVGCAGLNGAGVGVSVGFCLLGEDADADSDEHAVERLVLAMLPEQSEKAEPSGTIYLLGAVLRGVPARGIDQYSLVGEHPFAITRATDAGNGLSRVKWEAKAAVL